MTEHIKLRSFNRIKRRTAKRHRAWCGGCDRSYLAVGKKCKICGFRDMKGSKREKK
jgi:hypothetical protein